MFIFFIYIVSTTVPYSFLHKNAHIKMVKHGKIVIINEYKNIDGLPKGLDSLLTWILCEYFIVFFVYSCKLFTTLISLVINKHLAQIVACKYLLRISERFKQLPKWLIILKYKLYILLLTFTVYIYRPIWERIGFLKLSITVVKMFLIITRIIICISQSCNYMYVFIQYMYIAKKLNQSMLYCIYSLYGTLISSDRTIVWWFGEKKIAYICCS